MFVVRQVLTDRAVDDDAKTYLSLALQCLDKNRGLFDDMVSRLGADVRRNYSSIAREVFADREINPGRIVALFAFAIHVQRRFNIDLVDETQSAIDGCRRHNWLTLFLAVITNCVHVCVTNFVR